MTESSSARSPYPVRPITPDEFGGFHLVHEHAFGGGPMTQEDRRVFLPRMEFDRSLAAFDGDTIISAAGAYSFMLSVPGGQVLPAAGVSLVGVLPTYRRRGVLTSMMRRQLDDVRDRGEPLAVLWASEAPIYSRYGYGRASWLLSYTIKRGEGALAGPVDPAMRLRLADPSDARPEMAKVYEEVMASRPGMFARGDAWWQRSVHDPAAERGGAGPLRCLLAEHDGQPRGYALYSGHGKWESTLLPDGVITVRELMSSTPQADAALWGDLLSRDLIGEFRASLRPVDDPVLYQLADSRRVRAQLSDALWARITDVPAALSRRSYAAPVDVVISVADGLIPSNAGTWRLTAAGSGDVASCVPAAGSDSDVQLDISALGAAYLGGTRLGALAGAGLVGGRPGAIRQLSAAMSWDPAPWCPVIF